MRITATRFHDFSCGHRVRGHESKCANLHGHNYRVHFVVSTGEDAGELDDIGRVMDFSVINSRLCQWLEEHWDHKFLAWREDELMLALVSRVEHRTEGAALLDQSIVWVPFNPTAENMAKYLLEDVGPLQLARTGVVLEKVIVEETRKCSASADWGSA